MMELKGMARLKAKCAKMGIPYTEGPESLWAVCEKIGIVDISDFGTLDSFLDAIDAVEKVGRADAAKDGGRNLKKIRKNHAR